jgi:Protein of unknown function (DUF3224)
MENMRSQITVQGTSKSGIRRLVPSGIRRLAPSTIVLCGVLAGFAHQAVASPPAAASGGFTFLSDALTPIRTADGNLFLDEVASISYTGDLNGIAAATDTILVHSNGSVGGHGTESCATCTLDGRTGSFTAAFTFRGSGAQFTGHETFTSASGGLAGLHGGGTFAGTPLGDTYSYNYRFAP